jgi:Na+/H+ antiporter NhaC
MSSERENYMMESRSEMLRGWVLAQMMRGAGYAAVVVLGVALVIWAIYGVGLLLPAESRETPPPMGALEMPAKPDLA